MREEPHCVLFQWLYRLSNKKLHPLVSVFPSSDPSSSISLGFQKPLRVERRWTWQILFPFLKLNSWFLREEMLGFGAHILLGASLVIPFLSYFFSFSPIVDLVFAPP